jgi:hypothetical protein
VLDQLNATYRPVPRTTRVELLAAQSRRMPQEEAVVSGSGSLSYRELTVLFARKPRPTLGPRSMLEETR